MDQGLHGLPDLLPKGRGHVPLHLAAFLEPGAELVGAVLVGGGRPPLTATEQGEQSPPREPGFTLTPTRQEVPLGEGVLVGACHDPAQKPSVRDQAHGELLGAKEAIQVQGPALAVLLVQWRRRDEDREGVLLPGWVQTQEALGLQGPAIGAYDLPGVANGAVL